MDVKADLTFPAVPTQPPAGTAGDNDPAMVIGAVPPAAESAAVAEDNLLSSFFSDVTTAAAVGDQGRQRVEQEQRAAQLTDKYCTQDLGTPTEQYSRLTSGNYQWRNLNPYETLQLGVDATVEDIKYRYIKIYLLSLLLLQ